ncbi:MAG: DUF3516 domain-containing protein [Acidimicrobiia bacterium]
MTTQPTSLQDHYPAAVDPDTLLTGFLEYCDAMGLSLYPAQEEAIIEVFTGDHVILNTPTGSGKSLVALAAHYAAVAAGQTSWYTAPVKALVSEKFFELCRVLGADNVGMLTGDATVNAGAPVICCTAEILANTALRHGAAGRIDHVCMDEFHFYADRDRGWAWQVPLLELTRTRFLLMSATLGDVAFFAEDLTRRTGRRTAVVKSATRPVPLEYVWRTTPLHESVQELLDTGRAPVYVVHFTQRDATEHAQALTSVEMLARDEKAAIREHTDAFRFDSPFGKDLKRFLHHGVGVHHAGLLPKYRRLVETLAERGLLRVICGTDTLGVGVNVPIRTVLFTQLCKYDGERTRILSARDFQQIAGRAGRKGYDDEGFVWVQAPAHEIENARALAKAGDDAKKRRKVVKKKPPEFGYVHWSEKTFTRLVAGLPETLRSSFDVTPAMVIAVLDRPGDGCAALKRLLLDNHDDRPAVRSHVRRAIAIYRSLLAAGVVERLGEPDDLGRSVRVVLDLQSDFSLNQPLSPFVLHALGQMDRDDDAYALDVLSVVEAVLENPMPVLRAQLSKLRTQLLAELKAEGVPFEERNEMLDEVTWPKPLAEFVYTGFDAWRVDHPWVGSDNVAPKSVVRDLYEQGGGFGDYVGFYGLRGSEGVVLRYLSDAYKALVQNVPEDAKTDDLYDLTEWLGAVVRGVDSSLLDEWERLQHPETFAEGPAETPVDAAPPDVTANRRAFRVMVRNECFRWVRLLAANHLEDLAASLPAEEGWSPARLAAAIAPYREEHAELRTDAEARGPQWHSVEETGAMWRVVQVLADPDETGEWRLVGRVDIARSRDDARAVVRLDAIERL